MAFLNWLSTVARSSRELNPQFLAIRERLRNNPYYRLQSTEEIRVAAVLGIKIDANQASVDDWLRLPGLSIHQARSLVNLAQSGVHFYCVEDIAAALGMPVQRLKPLEPVLSFCYYDAESTYTICPVNPNTATVEVLLQIPILDAFLAKAIVHNRLTVGPYRNLADLQQRLFLPRNLTAELMHYLRF
jgi:DNA uptake protein ComE-like DNA-binding protein